MEGLLVYYIKSGAEEIAPDFFIRRKLVTQNCVYCGIEPRQIYKKKNTNGSFVYNGIDRINNNKVYTIKNCVPACKFCNYAKKRGTQKEFLNWVDRLKTLGR